MAVSVPQGGRARFAGAATVVLATVAASGCTDSSSGGASSRDTAGSPSPTSGSSSTAAPFPSGTAPITADPPVQAPPVPSLESGDGTGVMTLRITGAGEVSYRLAPASCSATGFDADAEDGSAQVQLADGTVRIRLAGAASPMSFPSSAERRGAVWSAEGADAARGSSFAVRVSCA